MNLRASKVFLLLLGLLFDHAHGFHHEGVLEWHVADGPRHKLHCELRPRLARWYASRRLLLGTVDDHATLAFHASNLGWLLLLDVHLCDIT